MGEKHSDSSKKTKLETKKERNLKEENTEVAKTEKKPKTREEQIVKRRRS